ncbi:MAG: hypothetical protein KDC84_12690, partial [Crocinitomicaceae bacterium]|nr:hypothetical protein [Crocinitomicaceae bacterium]
QDKYAHFGTRIFGAIAGILGIYAALFATGNFIYGETTTAMILVVVCLISFSSIYLLRKKLF